MSLAVSQMDPVQKAVINHTFGVPQPLKKKQIISCNICHLRFNSTVRNGAFFFLCELRFRDERLFVFMLVSTALSFNCIT